MRSWATTTLTGSAARQNLLRLVLGVLLVAALVWGLPVRQPGEEGGHHAHHAPAPAADADPFERAGITELREGQRGPAFELDLFTGGRASLDTWRGHLVVLNFWATWCTPCTLEMPTLESLWREYRDRGLVVVGISVDRGAPRGLLEPYVAGLQLTFPILLDADLRTAGAWRVTGLPATFIIRPDGDVAGMAFGAREWNSAAMKNLLHAMLPPAIPIAAPANPIAAPRPAGR
jgi:peroxiredoxin